TALLILCWQGTDKIIRNIVKIGFRVESVQLLVIERGQVGADKKHFVNSDRCDFKVRWEEEFSV
ncbi:hypothetical protein AD949_00570, partial [Acetobacter orleanensis]